MSTRLRVLCVLGVSAIGGAGTMTVELSAVRLLAPWFGSSLVVWSNVIAVVLLALAVGYLVGGRLSGAGRPLRTLGWMLAAAAVTTAFLPLFSGPVAESFLPAGLTLGEAAEVVKWGSLAASLLLFLVPAALLGTVAPLAVEVVQELERRTAGHAGGAVLCASTLGSLVGVFGTSHVFLPVFGLTGTFRLAAGFLLVAGVLALLLARSGKPGLTLAGVAVLLCASAAFLGSARRPELPDGLLELAHVESPYQSVRVVEDTRDPLALLRYLQVNEGFDSYQSVWQPDAGLLPVGYYYNDFVLPAWWGGEQGTWSLLVLGLGAGTAVRVMEGVMPPGLELEATGIELDPLVVDLARGYMDLAEESRDRVVAADLDARVALHNLDARFDQIILDCYANQVEIPAHLCTKEFFQEARERLADGGWLVANLGGFGFDDPVVEAVAHTCAVVFEGALLLRVPRARNFTLVARRNAPLPVEADGAGVGGGLLAIEGEPARLLAPRGLPGAWHLVAPDEELRVLTDDRCPIERLQLASIAEGARRLRERGE